MAYLTMLSVAKLQTVASNYRMMNELERIWKATWPNLMQYPGICLERLRKTTKTVMVCGIGAEI
jgi:hypothetical protein